MDATVIPFPTREPPPPDPEAVEEVLDAVTLAAEDDPTAGCEGCGSITDEHDADCPSLLDPDDGPEEDPDEIVEAGGRWVWQPTGRPPEDEPPVGMVAHKIRTMCRWQYRHIADREPMPQPCCYSVLITTARLPGPVRRENHWLAQSDSVVPHD